ncbi:uncharacterized protein LOC125225093 [Leguminivora glycinivorella]|uniref:uncharacterized protein LOC125225093 n=1 Tax=Leguminivora glycinivorella TaxID=1035111 RepID=UPI00200EF9EC|nr:uncharacterized protein LOC125225093 [Leguminivora glycinivorella]
MPKFTFVLVILALAVSVQGFPTFEDDVATAAASGNWAKVHEILRRNFAQSFGPHAMGDVRSLKPPSGGHVFAEAQSTFEHASSVAGKSSHERGGHKVVNNDGKVAEWDLH